MWLYPMPSPIKTMTFLGAESAATGVAARPPATRVAAARAETIKRDMDILLMGGGVTRQVRSGV